MPNGEVLDELNLIPFVGELRAKVLRENGIRDVETLLKYPIEKLAELDGFSMKIAQKIRRYAAEVESLGLVGKEPIKELVLREFRCPRCDAIVSRGESVCHRCGKVFYPSPPNAEDIIANSHFEILKNPDDPEVWRKRAMILENLGLHDESTICMLKVDFLEMFESERPPKEERKRPVKKGLVNGNGVVANNGVVGGLFPKIESRKTLPFLIAVMIILPIIVLSTSLATKGIEIDGYFDDWKNIKGIELYSQDNIIQEIKYYNDGRTFIYIKFGENIFVSPKKYYYTVIGVFFDTDMNNGTGYKIGGIGADKVLLMYGYGGKVKSAKFMNYNGEGINWKWDEGVKVSAKTDGKEVEAGLPNIDKFVALVVYRDVGGEVVSSTFSTSKGVFCIITDEDLNVISKNENVCTIKLYSLSPEGTTISLRLINKGTAKEASFQILDETGNVISTSGEISQLRVNKPRNLMVVYTGGASSGESIYLDVKIDAKSYVKNYARGKYIDTMPSSPIIDGVYADWNYISDKGDSTDKDVDICWAAMYSKNNTTLLSLAVCGEILKGLYMPVSLYMDLDRDTVPDPEDEYPNDFNNDGVPDSESKTSDGKPDIDGDGIADYPYGNDKWLNTTIDGRNISIRLGEKASPLIGEEEISIIFLKAGSVVGKINIKGFDNKVIETSCENIKYNSKYLEIFYNKFADRVVIVVKISEYFDEVSLKTMQKIKHKNVIEDNILYKPMQEKIFIKKIGKYSSPIILLSFGTDVPIDNSTYDTIRPSITRTSDGTLWVVYDLMYSGNHYIFFANSTNNGGTWEIYYFTKLIFSDYCYPVIASDNNDYVYIFFENHTSGSYFEFLKRDPSTGDWTLHYIYSWTWWSNVRNISVWIKGNAIWLTYEYIFSSSDYDINWTLGTQNGWRTGALAASVNMEKHPSITVSDSHAVIAYQVYDGNEWNITVKHSDGVYGYNFTTSTHSGECYSLSGLDDINPSLYASGNIVWIAWERVFSPTDHDIRYTNSTDGGASFWYYQSFSTSSYDERYPSIACVEGNPNHLMVVYVNSTTKSLMAAESTDGGSNWSIMVINDTCTTYYTESIYRCAQVRYFGGYFYVVWTEAWNSTDRDIFFDKEEVFEFNPSILLITISIAIPVLRRIELS